MFKTAMVQTTLVTYHIDYTKSSQLVPNPQQKRVLFCRPCIRRRMKEFKMVVSMNNSIRIKIDEKQRPNCDHVPSTAAFSYLYVSYTIT